MILLRHGQSHFNAAFNRTRIDPEIPDAPLTETGQAQALAAASRLAGRGLRRIVSSPYTRALQTASIVAEMLELPITIDPLVGERAALSCDIGTPTRELALAWPALDLSHLPERWWPELEEPETALRVRAEEFRTLMAGTDDRHAVLVVSHWGFIRALTGREVTNCEIVAYDWTAHDGDR
ncbi:histidine phosphatase family protein [Arenibaculum sp.]|uniref:histidine phosphatase family protein n=1 Tax=Arenibaculum sp. TaxID=2865862 RepID=UPI002E120278|nr:histidine phosphatase family protein [Arenibaculum sp.]